MTSLILPLVDVQDINNRREMVPSHDSSSLAVVGKGLDPHSISSTHLEKQLLDVTCSVSTSALQELCGSYLCDPGVAHLERPRQLPADSISNQPPHATVNEADNDDDDCCNGTLHDSSARILKSDRPDPPGTLYTSPPSHRMHEEGPTTGSTPLPPAAGTVAASTLPRPKPQKIPLRMVGVGICGYNCTYTLFV